MQYCATYLDCSGTNYSLYTKDDQLKFERCNDCGIIWRTKKSIDISKPYEQEYFYSKKYEQRRKHKVMKSGWLIDLARLHNPGIKSLLEVGCSIGYTLEAAALRNIDHLGIDVSSYAVNYCKKKGLHAITQTLEELLLTNKKYDLIFKQHVLEHFKNPFQVLQQCRKLLNPNGIILVMVPNSKYIKAEKKRENHRFYSKKGVGAEHYTYFNYNNLQSVLNSCGFEIEQINYPIFISKYSSFNFFLNRIGRRLLSCFNFDQEILLIARKID